MEKNFIRLGVNVDHIATLREVRKAHEPDPVAAAAAAEMAGADQITVHLREDRRHIQNRDVRLIREVVKSTLNLEMAATTEMQEIALAIRPHAVCIVPEKREEITTEGGLNLMDAPQSLGELVATLKDAGIMVTAFLDPDLKQIHEAARFRFDAVEMHTGAFSNASRHKVDDEVANLKEAANAIRHLGMRVHAGHGLDYHNLTRMLEVPYLEEVNIGHAIIARSVFTGLDRAVRDMLQLLGRA
ncbi:MAG TPA: pyridoxine 5'-phosphate synthase [Candidatus Krumholzibacteria bacterium]|nr:pyridoxine 5'-phosphate synthase [Candidatus Krumholzibacteria bacterium]